MSARFEPDTLEKRKPLSPDELVNLGIDESKHSSLAWVGYDEYRKHLARLSEVEQAAFTESATGPPVETPPAEVAPIEAVETPAAAQADETPSPDAEARAEAEAPAESAARTDAPERDVADPALVEAALPLFREFIEAALAAGVSSRQPEDAPRDERRVQAAEAGPSGAAPSPKREAEPRPPAPRPAADAEVGAAATKESDPTSPIEVPLEMLGQPLAGQGLMLEPRRPKFPPLVRVTAVFGNPLVEIRFARDGKPDEAEILESSGDGRVDHAIGVSLYRWRAKGAALEDLAPEETLSVRLRIILNSRARSR